MAERIDARMAGTLQFPQGGIDGDEEPRAAAIRELEEETGISAALVDIVHEVDEWIAYDFPPDVVELLKTEASPAWRGVVGQVQVSTTGAC